MYNRCTESTVSISFSHSSACGVDCVHTKYNSSQDELIRKKRSLPKNTVLSASSRCKATQWSA